MSVPVVPDPAKLVIGIFTADSKLITGVAQDLKNRFGSFDLISQWFHFDYTDYYTAELGSPLFRRLFACCSHIDQGDLADIKLATNEVEQNYLENGARRVNIDPGYILRERFVLATGKNYAHRIYLGKKIYADLTLIYRHGGFQTLPWTYPDYADRKLRNFLEQARKRYIIDLKKNSPREPKDD